MTSNTVRQFGLWDSPISPRSLAEGKRLSRVEFDTDGKTCVWLEGRSGVGVLVAQAGTDAPRDLTADLNVRAEVGYGGGDFTVAGGYVYFAVLKSNRLYRQPLAAGPAVPITPAFGNACSPVVSPDGKWLVYVHSDADGNDRLAVVDVQGQHWPKIAAAGHDFYMFPRISSDGRRLAWIAWDHPNMPWDGTRLYLAEVTGTDGNGLPTLGEPRVVAGGDHVSVSQPEFTPDGKQLLFASDESGWSRLAVCELPSGELRWLTGGGSEVAVPAWNYDPRTYAVGHDSRYVVVARNELGFQRLERIGLATVDTAPLAELEGYGEVSDLVAAPDGARIAFIGSGPTIPPRVVIHDLDAGTTQILARSSGETVADSALAACEPLCWKTAEGDEAHGLFYAPASDRFEAEGQPPLIVLVHGGPTSQVRAGWRADAQYFATRGYAVLFVNYRGGTGYGRKYMLKLRGTWGLLDVEDSISGKDHLAAAGRIDPNRTVIMGGSAGGFTVLQTMTQEPEAFSVGVSLYGVANQFTLAADTHKYESRYLDTILGPLPEASAIYRARSPIFHADNITRPLAVYQGEIDQVVPRDQADAIVEVLKRRGIPHVYHLYEGEGHGWRKRETIEHFYTSLEAFLREHLLFA